jgi:hypothetical protein
MYLIPIAMLLTLLALLQAARHLPKDALAMRQSMAANAE